MWSGAGAEGVGWKERVGDGVWKSLRPGGCYYVDKQQRLRPTNCSTGNGKWQLINFKSATICC